MTAQCAFKGCQWRIHASKEGNKEMFRIKMMYLTHICSGDIGTILHPKASKKWVNACVIQKLKDHLLYRTIDIQRDMLQDHGVNLSYKQDWLGKEVTHGVLHGSELESYNLLIWYASKIMETNLGSIAIVDKDENRFRHMFFSFYACIIGFKSSCRPWLFIDGTHLLGKYGGTLLGATSKDGNDGFLHVTFVIVDNKMDSNWTWVLLKLGDALNEDNDYMKIITFISDKSNGLISAIVKVFPSSPHAYCFRHLEVNFMKGNIIFWKKLKKD
ncbi:uncharacterized protein LOC120252524 [Dioscorea cayenensis subsp. rotundata]|uniref:Uncharacterized protein LOC120252524 n=1 Tax=Dioscorea cayennensis subsp. rotundata TaxID=55577 RepID=A0AB40ANP7_DIOCR|nr:uncharacterized protein LOC120252524 [Dioscorea cayenensis subsp. rotundata]